MNSIHENFIQMNVNSHEYILQNNLQNIGSCYHFTLNFTNTFSPNLEDIKNTYLPKALNLFQKYICQNIRIIDDNPDIFIYYTINYIRKQHNKPSLKTKTWSIPKINGFIFTTSYLPEKKYYGMNCGLKRETFFKLQIELITQKKNIFIETLKDEYEDEYETILNNHYITEYNKNNTFHNIFEKYKHDESFLLKCNTIKYLSSQGELKCSQILSKHKDIKVIKKQYIFNDCININPLPFDFYIELKNGIYFLLEYHGQQHYKEVPLWDGENGFKQRQYRDNIKIDYCKKHNIPLCIISYRQFNNIENEINLFIDNFIKNENLDDKTIKIEKTILDFI